MTYLLYYAKERADFPLEFFNYLNINRANCLISKLIKHFKITSHNEWKFSGGKSSKCITYKNTLKGRFIFSKTQTSLGVICHELAHAIEINRRGKTAHAKKHYNIMKKLILYCRKMGYTKDQDVVMIVSGKPSVGMSTMGMQLSNLIWNKKMLKKQSNANMGSLIPLQIVSL